MLLNEKRVLVDYTAEDAKMDLRTLKEVFDEVAIRGRNLSGAEEVASVNWIKVENVMNKIAVESLSMTLDRGEAEAIVLAKEKDGLLIIDDGKGRRAAEFFGLRSRERLAFCYWLQKTANSILKRRLTISWQPGFRLSEKEYKRILNLN